MRIDLTIPPNTQPSAPLSKFFVFMEAPVISRETIEIPKGHAYLTGLQMYAGGRFFHVLPEANSGSDWITSDGVTIEKGIRVPLEAPRYMLEFRAYNQDGRYAHTFHIDIS